MASFEDILAFSQIRKYLSTEQESAIVQAMGTNIEEINRRMIGIDKEYEFLLMLLFMDNCESVSGFDEGILKLFYAATSDLIVVLKCEKKFLLEIKHTGKEKYQISSKKKKKRIDYAESVGLDLYFAISIKGFWMLFKSDYLKNNSGKITVADYKNSELDNILGTYSYMFPNGIKIKSVYKKNYKNSIGIKHNEYGELVSYEFYYKSRKLFRIKGKNSPHKGYSMILEALQDRMSNVSQDIQTTGDTTVIIEEFPDDDKNSFNMISEYSFLLSPIRHTVNDNGENYTERTAVESLKSDETIMHFQKEHIRRMMKWLAEQGVPVRYVQGGKNVVIQPTSHSENKEKTTMKRTT